MKATWNQQGKGLLFRYPEKSKFDERFLVMKDVSQMREHIKGVIDELDDTTVEKVFQLLEDDGEDLLAHMSPEQEISFFRGLKDADEGRTTPHEEVMKKYEEWLTK